MRARPDVLARIGRPHFAIGERPKLSIYADGLAMLRAIRTHRQPFSHAIRSSMRILTASNSTGSSMHSISIKRRLGHWLCPTSGRLSKNLSLASSGAVTVLPRRLEEEVDVASALR